MKEMENFADKGNRMQFLDLDSYEKGMLRSLAVESSLFGDKTAYLIENPLTNSKVNDDLLIDIEDLKNSDNLFVIVEGPLKAEEKKQWNKHFELQEFKAEADARFNTFALADALVKRDRKSLWLIWSEARLSGIVSEELVGIIWWQLKSIRLAAVTSSAEEAGMKDYPYQKSKRALSKFPSDDPERLSRSLLDIYHQSRLGGLDLDLAVERWLLRI